MKTKVEERMGLNGSVQEETTDYLKEKLRKKNEKISADCSKEIEEVLKKHNCSIDVQMIISAAGSRPIVNIIPRV